MNPSHVQPVLVAHWEATTAAPLVKKEKHQQNNEVTSSPDSNRNLKAHLTCKCLQECIWIMARGLTLEGTEGKVDADKESISGEQARFLVQEIKASALSLTWLNSDVVSKSEKGWCRLMVQLLYCFLFGVQKCSWEKRSELYTTWKGNGMWAERCVGRERVQIWITLIKLRNSSFKVLPCWLAAVLCLQHVVRLEIK